MLSSSICKSQIITLPCGFEKDLSSLKLKLLLNRIATPALAPMQQLKIVSYPHSALHIDMFFFRAVRFLEHAYRKSFFF